MLLDDGSSTNRPLFFALAVLGILVVGYALVDWLL